MEQNEAIFQISVTLNPGLEPLTLDVTPQESGTVTNQQALAFIVNRYEDHICTLVADENHRWQQTYGELDQKEIDVIGAAIDSHYA